MDPILYIVAGASVGLAIGLTGVGGGSLMTPLLLMFGFPPHIAIGTDLLYASITKSGGVLAHHKASNIDWPTVRRMAIGSLPAAALTGIALSFFFTSADDYGLILQSCLGIMLMITASVLIFKQTIRTGPNFPVFRSIRRSNLFWTTVMGVILGVFVTLSSVGAGAFGTAILMILYPHFPSVRIVGTDLAHAVPLTLIAGLAHMSLGHVDFKLLAALLVGSLPATYIGARLGSKLPENVLQPILAVILFALGVKYTWFS